MPGFYECHKVTAGVADLAWEAALSSNRAYADLRHTERVLRDIEDGKEPFGWGAATTDRVEGFEYERDKAARDFGILSAMAAVVMKQEINNPFAKDQIAR